MFGFKKMVRKGKKLLMKIIFSCLILLVKNMKENKYN